MKAVGEADPRCACEVTLSGSNAESCKVGEPNEFDFMFYLPSLAENFGVAFKKGKDSEFVRDLLKMTISLPAENQSLSLQLDRRCILI